ncbi:33694_t:CDS:2, partial [Gigaspora margarita]
KNEEVNWKRLPSTSRYLNFIEPSYINEKDLNQVRYMSDGEDKSKDEDDYHEKII